jgi:1,4-dihydroxy-2-naphthoate octaprenyltransferase
MHTVTGPARAPKILIWLKIARLQFYPMALIAYSVGAACAATIHEGFHLAPYLAGYLYLFLLELCTVLVNERFDYGTDALNENGSLYSGGSRVLVDKFLSFSEVNIGIMCVLVLLLMSMFILIRVTPYIQPGWTITILIIGLALGIGYTAPPLKLCYRGLGELVVGFTHGPYVLLSGFILQAGTGNLLLPWFLSMPLFFAVFAAITLSALPDYQADKSVSKNTLAVHFGPRTAAVMAIVSVISAVVSTGILVLAGVLFWSGIALLVIAVPHAVILVRAVARVRAEQQFNKRIDSVMQLALSYILWFGLIPLLGFL